MLFFCASKKYFKSFDRDDIFCLNGSAFHEEIESLKLRNNSNDFLLDHDNVMGKKVKEVKERKRRNDLEWDFIVVYVTNGPNHHRIL